MNVPSVIGSLTASPALVSQGGRFSLTANEVGDADGSVVQVRFYHGELLLGSVEADEDGWTLTVDTIGWDLGEHTLVARARDNHGAWSELATVTAQVSAQLDSLLFGVVPVFASRQIGLEIDNEGSEPLTVNPGDVTAPFTIAPSGATGDPGEWVVPPGATKVFFVRYWPMEDGTHVADWALADDPQGRLTQLSGLAYSGHQNPLNPFDVNGDGHVTPLDVLLLINEINSGGGGPLSPRTAEQPGLPWFVDVTSSGTLIPNDVLQVINHINESGTEEERSGEAAEGESAGDRSLSSDDGWLAMVNVPMLPVLPVGRRPQSDPRVDWLTDAVDDLAYWTTRGRPDLPLELATWQRLGADAWQPDDWELPDWEALLDDPDMHLADLDAYSAALA